MITVLLIVAGLGGLLGIVGLVNWRNAKRELREREAELKATTEARAKDLKVDAKLRELDTKRVDEASKPSPAQPAIERTKSKRSIADELNKFNRGKK